MSIGISIGVSWAAPWPYYFVIADFRARATADSGIFEAFGCVSKALSAFPQPDIGRQLMDAYNTRVVAAGGNTEARTCTINELNDLL
jgi:hypothetical protein